MIWEPPAGAPNNSGNGERRSQKGFPDNGANKVKKWQKSKGLKIYFVGEATGKQVPPNLELVELQNVTAPNKGNLIVSRRAHVHLPYVPTTHFQVYSK